MKKTKFYLASFALLFLFNTMRAQVHYVNTTTNNENSSAIGYGTVASGEKSFASGINSTAQGICSSTLGQFNEALGHYSVTIGCNLKAINMRSMVIGSGYSDYFKLENNKLNSLMIGFLSQYPTLFIGTSPSYNKTGKIGIGNVTEPEAKLHIRSDVDSSATLYLQPGVWNTAANAQIWMGNKNNGISADYGTGMVYHTENNHVFEGGDVIVPNNSMGIGTNNTYGYALAVKGKILTDEVMIKHPDDWYDFVFKKEYKLTSLDALEQYIEQNNHLPDIPSESEVKSQGIELSKMNGLLLKKIEELTLYIIEQQKALNTQQKEIDMLKKVVKK